VNCRREPKRGGDGKRRLDTFSMPNGYSKAWRVDCRSGFTRVNERGLNVSRYLFPSRPLRSWDHDSADPVSRLKSIGVFEVRSRQWTPLITVLTTIFVHPDQDERPALATRSISSRHRRLSKKLIPPHERRHRTNGRQRQPLALACTSNEVSS